MLRRLLLTACVAAAVSVGANPPSRLFRQPNASAPPAPTVPKEGWSKAYVSDPQRLFAEPNATTAPAVVLLEGVESEILEQYPSTTLAYIRRTWLDFVRARANALSLGFHVHDDADRIFAGRTVVDSRIGVERSLGAEVLDPPYATDDVATWIVQFHGIEKPDWVPALESVGALMVDRLVWNATIVAATPSQIEAISAKPFVQFHTQFHSVMKKSASINAPAFPLWIYVARAGRYEAAIERIRGLAGASVDVMMGERAVQITGTFPSTAVDAIAREPLVYSVTGPPPPMAPPPSAPVAIPTLSPAALAFLAAALVVFAVLRAR